jgi:Fe2+ or Zn2+ uptake regulation protein
VANQDQTLASLRASGRRITAQRKVVLEVISASEEHLDAEAVYARARKRDPKISLATVYRTLAVLKTEGLVEQRYVARSHEREYYEPVGAREHYHFTCRKCGQAVEFESTRVQEMRFEVQQSLGAEVTGACVCLEGICHSCAALRAPA